MTEQELKVLLALLEKFRVWPETPVNVARAADKTAWSVAGFLYDEKPDEEAAA